MGNGEWEGNDAVRRVAINGDDGRPFEDGRKHACGGDRAGESSRCEDPAPTVGIGGEIVAGYAAPTIICAHGRINGNGEWEDNDAAL